MDNFNLSKYLKNNPLLKQKGRVNESIGGYRDIKPSKDMSETYGEREFQKDQPYHDEMPKEYDEVTIHYKNLDQEDLDIVEDYTSNYDVTVEKSDDGGLSITGLENEVESVKDYLKNNYSIEPSEDMSEAYGERQFQTDKPYHDEMPKDETDEDVTRYYTLADADIPVGLKISKKYPGILFRKTSVKLGLKGTSPGNVQVEGPRSEVDAFQEELSSYEGENI